MSNREPQAAKWPWPESFDAVTAAPKSHKILINNEKVRVLEIVIRPGEKEPMHTHKWPSVMIVDQRARIRYYNENDELVFESPEDVQASDKLNPDWMAPEGLHAVENIDAKLYYGIRIEIKEKISQKRIYGFVQN